VSDAWIYPLKLDSDGNAYLDAPIPSQVGNSFTTVLRDVFGVSAEFDVETERMLEAFQALKRRRLSGDASVDPELEETAHKLGERSEEVRSIVALEMAQLRRYLGAAE
jgi:hypothetical protein